MASARIATTASSFLLLTASFSSLADARVPGDIDLDGDRDIVDVRLVQGHVGGGHTLGCAEQIAADVDQDGDIDSADIDLLASSPGSLPNELNYNLFQPTSKTEAGSRDIRFMTFNLHMPFNWTRPPLKSWALRKQVVFAALEEHQPDVIGLQESPINGVGWRDIAAEFPDYDVASEPFAGSDLIQNPGGAGLYFETILYRKSRFTILDRGVDHVPDPMDPTRALLCSYNGSWDRFITWTRLEDKISKESFYVYDVHFCGYQTNHVAHANRMLTLMSLHESDDPIVVVGDFNPSIEGQPTLEAAGFVDTFRALYPDTTERGTGTGWGGYQQTEQWPSRTGRKFDTVFVEGGGPETCTAQIDYRREEWLDEDLDPTIDSDDINEPVWLYPSDHFAVMALVQMPGLDDDADGIVNQVDNCRLVANAAQTDTDGDGVGDDCDNCSEAVNPTQADADLDGFGNLCDGDINGDGSVDNLDFEYIGLAQGAACGTLAYDRRLDMNSNCHVNTQDFVYFVQQHGRGTPGPSGLPCAGSDEGPCRARLDDQDGDGIGDADDTCKLAWNPDQGDSDGDGIADACDVCPNVANPDQDESDCRVFLMSFSSRLFGRNSIGDLRITEDDLVAYDVASQTWTLYFDASDVGFNKGRLDGVATLADGSLLLSKSSPGSVGGITYDDSDILRFRPYTLGTNTTGSFELYFDGSEAGLETGGEDIDAIAVVSDSSFAISLAGNGRNLPGLETSRVRDEDVLIFSSETLGSETVGSFTVLISGNEIGLDSASEDIDALTIDSAGSLIFSVVGRYRVGEIFGDDADLLRFTPGEPEPGTFATIFEGDGAGLRTIADIGGLARAPHPWSR